MPSLGTHTSRVVGSMKSSSNGQQQSAGFSSTSQALARKNGPPKDRRITLLRYALHHPTKFLPRPLRLSRLRALRHWTIHRAWQLHLMERRQAEQLELERQFSVMRAACEELRTAAGDDGRLYRQAMSKKGIFGGRSDLGTGGVKEGFESGEDGRVERGREAGVPLEYARGQTDWPSRTGWDSTWTR